MKQRPLLLFGFLFGIASWLAEAAIHAYVFQQSAFSAMLFPANTNEIWMRLVIVTLFTAFGAWAQRKVDQSLRHEQHYRDVMASVFDVYYRADLDGRLIEVSPSSEQQTGYEPEEILGRALTDFYVEPEQRHEFMRLLKQHGKVKDFEVSLKHKNGHIKTVAVSSHLIFDSNNKPAFVEGVLHDITKRKQAEIRLAEKTAYLDSILRSATDCAIATTDLEFRITYYNPMAEKLFGYAAEEVIGKTVQEIHMTEKVNLERFDQAIADVHKSGEYFYTVEQETEDGKRFLESRVSAIYNIDGGLCGYAQFSYDVSNRKNSETKLKRLLLKTKQAETAALNMMEDANMASQKLQEIQARHEEAQRIAHLGYWSLDLISKELIWSDENHRIFGVEPGMPNTYDIYLQTVHPDDYEFVDKAYAESVQNRIPYDIEHRLLMRDGSVKWVHERCETIYDEKGTPIRSVGTTLDITLRKNAENLVQEENHILEILSSGSPLQEVLKALNLMIESHIPGSCSSILILDKSGKHLLTGSAPNLPEAYNLAINGVPIGPSAGSCGTAAYNDEAVIVREIAIDPLWEDYRKLALAHGLRACWSVPIHDAMGKVLGTFALYHDKPCEPASGELELIGTAAHISGIAIENRQADVELRKYRDHLEHLVWLRTEELETACDRAQASNRAKSTFLANMSHELRTPLNSILGFSELLSLDQSHPLHPDQVSQLGFILESGDRLLNLINDLLDLSKIEAGKMDLNAELFDVRELLQHAIKHHAHALKKKGLVVHCDYADDIALCNGDMQKIHQVLDNLLSNAIKFTPAGGAVSMQARRVGSEKLDVRCEGLDLSGKEQASLAFLKISITDTGIGIAVEDQDKLFQPFQQLDGELNRKYEGTGLGLSLCRKIITMHGGGIWLEHSELGRGSMFTFVIPADETGT